eukprot:gnl/Dysnectes_brevis/3513_a4459_1056.p1 GENE.gnl/Dysnectes_brevis/3513_a4459_1056~~gnl/Dysnectes_brevis/3513_a4459_1056.p1  ORF type:complete len:1145 (+),score=300.51 gnl/Dysnectes_brevis/3513_a4459_1056:95-3529(+)
MSHHLSDYSGFSSSEEESDGLSCKEESSESVEDFNPLGDFVQVDVDAVEWNELSDPDPDTDYSDLDDLDHVQNVDEAIKKIIREFKSAMSMGFSGHRSLGYRIATKNVVNSSSFITDKNIMYHARKKLTANIAITLPQSSQDYGSFDPNAHLRKSVQECWLFGECADAFRMLENNHPKQVRRVLAMAVEAKNSTHLAALHRALYRVRETKQASYERKMRSSSKQKDTSSRGGRRRGGRAARAAKPSADPDVPFTLESTALPSGWIMISRPLTEKAMKSSKVRNTMALQLEADLAAAVHLMNEGPIPVFIPHSGVIVPAATVNLSFPYHDLADVRIFNRFSSSPSVATYHSAQAFAICEPFTVKKGRGFPITSNNPKEFFFPAHPAFRRFSWLPGATDSTVQVFLENVAKGEVSMFSVDRYWEFQDQIRQFPNMQRSSHPRVPCRSRVISDGQYRIEDIQHLFEASEHLQFQDQLSGLHHLASCQTIHSTKQVTAGDSRRKRKEEVTALISMSTMSTSSKGVIKGMAVIAFPLSALGTSAEFIMPTEIRGVITEVRGSIILASFPYQKSVLPIEPYFIVIEPSVGQLRDRIEAISTLGKKNVRDTLGIVLEESQRDLDKILSLRSAKRFHLDASKEDIIRNEEFIRSSFHNYKEEAQRLETRLKMSGGDDRASLNFDQNKALEAVMSSKPSDGPLIIHGPPGTGKTMTIAAIAKVLCERKSMKVVIATPTNDASVACLLRILRLFPDELSSNVRRVVAGYLDEEEGLTGLLAKAAEHTVSLNSLVSSERARLLTPGTSITICTLSVSRRLDLSQTTHFLVDEASQVDVPTFLLPLCGGLNPSKCVIAHIGDSMQLRPVIVNGLAENKGAGISPLELLHVYDPSRFGMSGSRVHWLVQNYRSMPDIIQCYNGFFYGDRLVPVRRVRHYPQLDDQKIPQVALVDFDSGVMTTSKFGGSVCNIPEATRCAQIAKRFHKDLRIAEEDIVCLSLYRYQVQKLSEQLRMLGLQSVRASTITQFQGQEKPVVILSMTRSATSRTPFGGSGSAKGKGKGSSSDEDKDHLRSMMGSNMGGACVALSRAQDCLVVVGDGRVCRLIKHWALPWICPSARPYIPHPDEGRGLDAIADGKTVMEARGARSSIKFSKQK